MQNFLFQNFNNNHSDILYKKIYNDNYTYNKKDIDFINDDMLSSIILNKNENLFKSVIKDKKLNLNQICYLLDIISNEGDDYIYFFNILYNEKMINENYLLKLISNLIKSNSVNILKKINKLTIETEIINEAFKFSPNEEILNWIIIKKKDYLINNEDILNFIIKGDYLKLFIIYNKYNLKLNKSLLLNQAIKENAYEIIDYILNEIIDYEISENINIYGEYFDYLSSLTLEKIELFLSKIKNIKLFGVENIEKLLLGCQNNEDMEKLLFNYDLFEIKTNNIDLNIKIGKYRLNNQLNKQLKIKNKQNKKEKI